MSEKINKYHRRMERVIQFIYQQLAKPVEGGLTLETLSEVANLSKFHFHRIFTAIIGINTGKFINRLRLKKASYQLAFNPELKIIDIALDAGFENHESFSRAFKKTYQLTPKEFRKNPDWEDWSEQHQYQLIQENPIMDVTICQFPTTLIATLEHHGNPNLINQTIAKFIEWRKSTSESPINTADTFGLAYNDPASTPASQYRFDVCGSISAPIKENPQGVITKTIPGGRCAKITHLGSHDLMGDKIRSLYKCWVIQNDEEIRNFPCFYHFRNLFPQVDEHDLITDIYLPLV